MNIQTPFPDRPATPNWSSRGVFSSGRGGSGLPEDLGLGDAADVVGSVTGDITDVFRTIYSNQPGMYTAQLADGSLVTYRQPVGSTMSLPVGNIGGQLGANLQTTGGAGIWILLGIGALVFFMSRRK